MIAEQQSEKHIFISYARDDGGDFAAWFYDRLHRPGRMRPWRDVRDLDPHQDFSAEIEKAIEAADYMIVCLTPDVRREDSFVRREIQYALIVQEDNQREFNLEKPKIIPLLFPGGRPPVVIAGLTYIKCFDDDRNVDLVLALRALLTRIGVEWAEESTAEALAPVEPEPAPPALDLERDLLAVDEPTRPHPPLEITDVVAVESPAPDLVTQLPDPYRAYLSKLYRQIVDFLDHTVFSLIALRGEAAPEAVAESSRRVLPMSFADVALVEGNTPREFANFAEAFDHYQSSVLLLGEPGAGKTTTLYAYAREAVARRLDDPSLPLPIVLRIPDWPRDEQPELPDWIAAQTGLALEDVRRLLLGGRLFLLLDGLDELGASFEIARGIGIPLTPIKRVVDRFDPRQRFLDKLEQYTRVMPNLRVLLTSRVKDYSEIGQKAVVRGAVVLRSLDDAQMEEYLRGQPALLEAVRADEGLREMARTPLLLSLLTFAYSGMSESERQQLRDLGHSPIELRDKIFETYVRERFEHEARRPNVHLPFRPAETYSILGRVAAHDVRRNEINLSEFQLKGKRLSTERLHSFLDQMRRLNLLIGDNRNPRFIHLLIRDHFAASYALADLKGGWPIYTSINVLGNLRDTRSVGELSKLLLTSSHYSKLDFDAAIEALGKIGSRQAIPVLINILHDEERRVRTYERRGTRSAVFTGVFGLGCGFILYLAMCLGFILLILNVQLITQGKGLTGSFDGVASWVWPVSIIGISLMTVVVGYQMYSSDKPKHRAAAAEALGRIGDPAGVSVLQEVLNDKDRRVRKAAAEALQKINTPEALIALEQNR